MAIFTQDYIDRFSGVGRLFGWTGMERLRAAHVCVVGVGGVGSWAVEGLARSGVGALTIVDFDDVCVSNVNRQLPAIEGEIGRPKVEVLARRARLINPEIRVEAVAEFFTAATAGRLLGAGAADCIRRTREARSAAFEPESRDWTGIAEEGSTDIPVCAESFVTAWHRQECLCHPVSKRDFRVESGEAAPRPAVANRRSEDAPRFDCVIDAIDSMSNKALLIAECARRGLRCVTVGGAGGKRDASAIRTGDLGESMSDDLLRLVRKKLRRDHGFARGEGNRYGVRCVYSTEKPIFPREDDICAAEPGATDDGGNRKLNLDCESGFGTAVFVTGAFGLAAAGEAVRWIVEGEGAFAKGEGRRGDVNRSKSP